MKQKKEEKVLTYEADAEFMNDFLENTIMTMFDSGLFDDFFFKETLKKNDIDMAFKLKSDLKAVRAYLRRYPSLRKEQDWQNLVTWLENRIVINK